VAGAHGVGQTSQAQAVEPLVAEVVHAPLQEIRAHPEVVRHGGDDRSLPPLRTTWYTYHLVQEREAQMRHTAQGSIRATPAEVWAVFSDVARWPEWTDTVRDVRLLDGPDLAVGARVRIVQPRLPTVTWRVDVLDAPRCFSWVAGAPGARARAVHEVAPDGEGTRVDLTIDQTGLSAVFGLLTARLTQDYMDREAVNLARRVEGARA
jgi:carbon monoxide dehydrogenase subunit G